MNDLIIATAKKLNMTCEEVELILSRYYKFCFEQLQKENEVRIHAFGKIKKRKHYAFDNTTP